jgi:hypothetical protein
MINAIDAKKFTGRMKPLIHYDELINLTVEWAVGRDG